MTRFGYFLYSKEEDDFIQNLNILKNISCGLILYDEYTSINGEYPSLNLLFEKCKTGDLLILPSLDHLSLSIRQLSLNIKRLKDRNIDLIALDQETIDTIKFGSDHVYSIILDFCEFHSIHHSNRLLQRDFSNKRVSRGWNIEKVEVANQSYQLYKEGVSLSKISDIQGISLNLVRKYIDVSENGELSDIISCLKKRMNKKPHGKPKGLTKENKIKARKAKIMTSKKMSPNVIQAELDISKATYYRYLKLDDKNLYN